MKKESEREGEKSIVRKEEDDDGGLGGRDVIYVYVKKSRWEVAFVGRDSSFWKSIYDFFSFVKKKLV